MGSVGVALGTGLLALGGGLGAKFITKWLMRLSEKYWLGLAAWLLNPPVKSPKLKLWTYRLAWAMAGLLEELLPDEGLNETNSADVFRLTKKFAGKALGPVIFKIIKPMSKAYDGKLDDMRDDLAKKARIKELK